MRTSLNHCKHFCAVSFLLLAVLISVLGCQ